MEYFSRFMATLMLIILSPLLLLISSLSLVFQGNSVLFKQERIGFTYHPFMLVKFRSMIKNNGGHSSGINVDSNWHKEFQLELRKREIPGFQADYRTGSKLRNEIEKILSKT